MPQKKYIVRLTAQECEICQQTVRKLNGSSEKVRRAQILLKADADGPGWTDQQIADAISCRTKTVENIANAACWKGSSGRWNANGGRCPKASSCSTANKRRRSSLCVWGRPEGLRDWSLRLLARRVVELGVVESVSHETIRRTLKKTR